MNSELTQTGNVGTTDNPQGAGTSPGASNAADFQKAAGPEVLSQTRSLKVVNNGQPITAAAPQPAKSSAGAYIIIIIGAIAFLVLCTRLISWVKAAPPATVVAETVAPVAAPKPKAAAKKKGNKKQPRSKRRK